MKPLDPLSLLVFEKPPADFTPHVEVAACYVTVNGKALFLRISREKHEAGCWGVPAGKVEKGESLPHAAQRELFEETAILLPQEAPPTLYSSLYIRKPQIDYTYHLFQVTLLTEPCITLSREHDEYRWASVAEALSLPLMQGAKEALQYFCTATTK